MWYDKSKGGLRMNKDNLHALIDRYEADYEHINGPEHNEKFKWAAIRCFRDIWFSEEAKEMPFDKKFKLATKECSFLIDGGFAHPTVGIVKMAQQQPEKVASLFENLLFAPYASLPELGNRVDSFLEQINALRQELFPRYGSYKQDLHAASCYLTLFAPEKHFIYRYTYLKKFALYTEYGKGLDLPGLYDLSEIVVQALREHPTLMAKYDALFKNDEKYYYDESLHMMVYDLIYCCRCYNYYEGLSYTPPTPAKAKAKAKAVAKAQPQDRQKLQEEIETLDREIEELSLRLERLDMDEISLVGVEVSHPMYGRGIVTDQQANTITVDFGENPVRKYALSDTLTNRPSFEGEADVLPLFGEYTRLTKQIKKLESDRKSKLHLLDVKA